MADEKKTWLLTIESNLKKYAEEAAQAKVKVDELKASNDLLKKSGKESTAEYQLNNAELKNAQKALNDAQKMVQLHSSVIVSANSKEANSRKQLGEILRIQMLELGKMPDAYIKNAQGIDILNPKYVKQRQEIEATKSAIIKYDLALKDGRSNIGRYSEAIEGAIGNMSMIPGVAGQAGMAVQQLTTTMAKIGPMGALIAGAIAAISAPFVAFFKYSQQGMDLLSTKMAGIKAEINVVTGRLIMLGQAIVEKLDNPAKEHNNTLGILSRAWLSLMGIWTTAYKVATLIFPGIKEAITGLTDDMETARVNMEKYTEELHKLEAAEIALIKPRAEASAEIKKARLVYADVTKSDKERIEALDTALKKEWEIADKEQAHQLERINNLKILRDQNIKDKTITRDIDRQMAEAEAKYAELQGESAGRQVRATKALNNAKKELLAESFKIVAAEAKINEDRKQAELDTINAQKASNKNAVDMALADVKLTYGHYAEKQKIRDQYYLVEDQLNKKALEKEKEILTDKRNLAIKEQDTIIQTKELEKANKEKIDADYYLALTQLDIKYSKQSQDNLKAELDNYKKTKEDEKEYELKRRAVDEENKIATMEANNAWEYDIQRAQLKKEYDAEIENAQKTGADIAIINKKYQAAQRKIDALELNAKLTAYANFAGNIATIFGKNTAIGRAAAVAQTTIATFQAATEAYKAMAGIPYVGPALGIVAAAAAVAAGLANVRQILATKSGLPGDSGGGMPTAIVSSPAAMNTATPTGSTIFTQPQLSQNQLNTMASENLLTADDIKEALLSMPNPIVTVEDINARTEQVRQVEVRANI